MSLKENLLKAKLKIALVVLVIALGYGGWEGWKYYQYLQSSQYAFDMLKENLKSIDEEKLSAQVNFPSMSQRIAQGIARFYPFIEQGPNQQQAIMQRLQTYLKERLMAKEKGKQRELTPEEALEQPLEILPPDFVKQLQHSLALNATGTGNPDLAFVSATLHHPQFDKDFNLIFLLQRTPSGWVISDLANATELVAQFRDAQLKRNEAKRLQLIKKNEAIQQRMNTTLPIQSCEAAAGVISDNKTLLVRVIVVGRNATADRVNGYSLHVTILSESGKPILDRYLDKAMPLQPGEPFKQAWTIEMAADSETGKALLAGGKLKCLTRWQTVALNSGDVLYIREVKQIPEDFK